MMGQPPMGNPLTSMLYRLGFSIMSIWIAIAFAMIVVAELVRWMRILAPWAALAFIVGGAVWLISALIRRRQYGY